MSEDLSSNPASSESGEGSSAIRGTLCIFDPTSEDFPLAPSGRIDNIGNDPISKVLVQLPANLEEEKRTDLISLLQDERLRSVHVLGIFSEQELQDGAAVVRNICDAICKCHITTLSIDMPNPHGVIDRIAQSQNVWFPALRHLSIRTAIDENGGPQYTEGFKEVTGLEYTGGLPGFQHLLKNCPELLSIEYEGQAEGLRYILHYMDEPGSPDRVFEIGTKIHCDETAWEAFYTSTKEPDVDELEEDELEDEEMEDEGMEDEEMEDEETESEASETPSMARERRLYKNNLRPTLDLDLEFADGKDTDGKGLKVTAESVVKFLRLFSGKIRVRELRLRGQFEGFGARTLQAMREIKGLKHLNHLYLTFEPGSTVTLREDHETQDLNPFFENWGFGCGARITGCGTDMDDFDLSFADADGYFPEE